MHIGVVTTGYPHRGDAVAGCFVRSLSVALRLRGHAVTVLCAARPGDAPILDDGVRVVPVQYLGGRAFYGAGAPDNLRAAPLAALVGGAHFTARLAREARRHLARCDALVSHFVLPAGLVAGLVRDGRPHLAIVHGSDGWLLARAPAALQRAVLAGASHVQFTHQRLCDALPTGTAHTVRPMGVSLPESPSAPREARTLLSVGRLVPVKRTHLAVALAARLARLGTIDQLVVAGDGPLRSALEALARRLGAPVRFLGAISPSERDGWMARATLLVHTAGALPDGRTEGAPVVLLEAMASGLACLATEAGGAREILGDAGRVVAVEALEDAAVALLADGARREAMGRAGVTMARAHAWASEAARVEALLSLAAVRR